MKNITKRKNNDNYPKIIQELFGKSNEYLKPLSQLKIVLLLIIVILFYSNSTMFYPNKVAKIQRIECGKTIEGDLEGGIFVIDLGINSGSFDIEYTTYEVPDAISIYQDGQLVVNFGCVNTGGTKSNATWHGETIPFKGKSTEIEVRIYGNCSESRQGTGTGWKFEVKCPQQIFIGEKIQIQKLIFRLL